jgi:hypothetical protein
MVLPPSFTFISRTGLIPKHSRECFTPWSVFQDGPLTTITPTSMRTLSSISIDCIMQEAITLPEESHIPQAFFQSLKSMLACSKTSEPVKDERNVIDQVWLQALPFQQFHVLFHSLSKVLFIFRSLYLCAIGLWPIFSFRWNLPPILSCIPKQLDSLKDVHIALPTGRVRGSHPLRRSVPGDLDQRHC